MSDEDRQRWPLTFLVPGIPLQAMPSPAVPPAPRGTAMSRRQQWACAVPAEDTGSFHQDESTLQATEALVRAGRRAHHVSPGRAAHGDWIWRAPMDKWALTAPFRWPTRGCAVRNSSISSMEPEPVTPKVRAA